MKYDIIYADPPWHYAARKTGTKFGGGVTDKYPTMTIPQICDLEIPAADNSVLLIWTTMPYLEQCVSLVIPSWGFNYITCAFTWIKTNPRAGTVFKGIGSYTKSNAELCLLAKRGSGCKREAKNVAQVIMEPRREHRRKPDRVRDDIVSLFGDRPRLEMFARTTTPSWSVWGNQTDKFI